MERTVDVTIPVEPEAAALASAIGPRARRRGRHHAALDIR